MSRQWLYPIFGLYGYCDMLLRLPDSTSIQARSNPTRCRLWC